MLSSEKCCSTANAVLGNFLFLVDNCLLLLGINELEIDLRKSVGVDGIEISPLSLSLDGSMPKYFSNP